jgi:hypothetical protein
MGHAGSMLAAELAAEGLDFPTSVAPPPFDPFPKAFVKAFDDWISGGYQP